MAIAIIGDGAMGRRIGESLQTEIDVLSSAIVEAGKHTNIATPYNTTMMYWVKALKETFK